MKAHLYIDSGGMVTGTHDVKAARRLIVAACMDADLADCTDRYDLATSSAMFRAKDARLETGRVVPAGPDSRFDGYSWFWHAGYALGKPGVTRAVVWS